MKIGGRVRADYGMSQANATHKVSNGSKAVDKVADTSNTLGWEARGRIDFDARTPTAYGTVQTVAAIRLSRATGTFSEARQPKDAAGDSTTYSVRNASPSLEAAYIRFAGFTFGAARDNFAFMPSLTYGAGHWGSFANGAKQIAYTAVLGGGLSATVAVQDQGDTRASSSFGERTTGSSTSTMWYRYSNASPQFNGRIDLTQSWGSLSLAAATANLELVKESLQTDKQVWAVGAGAKINLPMLAKGSAFYVHAAYADGMNEYTVNWTGGKDTDTKVAVGGFAKATTPSVLVDAGTGQVQSVKSWVVAGLLEHYWTPEWRSVAWGTYGSIKAPSMATSGIYDGSLFFNDQKVWNVGKNIAWLPTRNFELGIEINYARVSQTIALTANNATTLKANDGAWTGRIRAERTF